MDCGLFWFRWAESLNFSFTNSQLLKIFLAITIRLVGHVLNEPDGDNLFIW